MRKFSKKFMAANMLASLALCMSVVAANSRCIFVFHQPKLPNSIKKLRKF